MAYREAVVGVVVGLAIGTIAATSPFVALLVLVGIAFIWFRGWRFVDGLIVACVMAFSGLALFTPLKDMDIATVLMPVALVYTLVFRTFRVRTRVGWENLILWGLMGYVVIRFAATPTIQWQGSYGAAKVMLKVAAGVAVFLTVRWYWEHKRSAVIWTILIAAAANAIYAVYLQWRHVPLYNMHYSVDLYEPSMDRSSYRIGSLVGSPFMFELLLASAALWYFVRVFAQGTSRVRNAYAVLAVATAGAMYLGQERSVFLGTLAAVTYALWTRSRGAGAVVGLGGLIGILGYVPLGGLSAESRFAVWHAALAVWSSSTMNALFGVGWGNFYNAYLPMRVYIPAQIQQGASIVSTQNALLDVLVTGGLVGATLFVGVVVAALAQVRRWPHSSERTWVLAVWIAFLIFLQFDVLTGNYVNMAWFGCLVGVSWSRRDEIDSNRGTDVLPPETGRVLQLSEKLDTTACEGSWGGAHTTHRCGERTVWRGHYGGDASARANEQAGL